jgi:hypothetical membrane protein
MKSKGTINFSRLFIKNHKRQHENMKKEKSLIRFRSALILIAVVFVNSLFATMIGVYFSNREITRTVSQNLTLVSRIAADIISSSIDKIKQDVGYVSSMMGRAEKISF